MTNRTKSNIEDRFLKDTHNHVMTILCDEGNTRSLLFKDPTCSYYYFRITTWEGHLCISGDMGTYVFSRTSDMFNFFRMDKEKPLNINPGYWHEKLVAEDCQNKSKGFSAELFNEVTKEYFENYCDDNCESEETKARIWKSIEENLLCSGGEREEEMREIVEDSSWVEYDDHEGEQQDFADSLKIDFWEESFQDYSLHYIWILYAIVWAIKQYDAHKASQLEQTKVEE